MTQANPDNIDATTLWRTVRRGLPIVLLLSLLAGGLTYLILSLRAPKYASQAEITIVAKGATNPFASPSGANATTEILSNPVDKEAVNTHLRAIQSPDIGIKIAKELHLNRLKEFNPILGPQDTLDALMRSVGLGPNPGRLSETDRVMKEYRKRLEVSSPAESRLISISFLSSDPELAAKIANRIAEAYRERLANVAVVETDYVQKALQPKIAKLTEEVADAEAEVVRFRVKAGLLRGGAQKTPLNDQQLGDLTTELTKAKAARAAADAKAKNASELMRRGTPEVIPEVQRSPLISQLIQQRVQVERDLLKFSATMKDAHPVIRQLNADLGAAKRQIAKEVANVVSSLEKEASVASQREASIKKSLDAIKSNVASESGDQVKLSGLEALAKSKREELNRLRAQFESNRVRADSGAVPVEAQIETRARASSIPVSPRKGMTTALTTIGTFLFGLAWIITRGLLKGARQPVANANVGRQDLNIRQASLEREPIQNAANVSRQQSQIRDGHSGPIQTVETGPTENAISFSSAGEIANHLERQASTTNSGYRTLLVSAEDGDATSSRALELAKSLSRSKNDTLLVDWDLSGKGISKAFGVKPEPGIADLVNNEPVTFADVVSNLKDTRAHIIPFGAPNSIDKKNLNGEQLNLVLDALDEAYDHIIIVSDRPNAAVLFETIGGRVDAGIALGPPEKSEKIRGSRPNQFLGFDVTDIELMSWNGDEPTTGQSGSPRRGRVLAPTRVR